MLSHLEWFQLVALYSFAIIGSGVAIKSFYYYVSFSILNFLNRKAPKVAHFIERRLNYKKSDNTEEELKNYYLNTRRKLEKESESFKNHIIRDKIQNIYKLIDMMENNLLSLSETNIKNDEESEGNENQ